MTPTRMAGEPSDSPRTRGERAPKRGLKEALGRLGGRDGNHADAVGKLARTGEDHPTDSALGRSLARNLSGVLSIIELPRDGRLGSVSVDVDDVVHVIQCVRQVGRETDCSFTVPSQRANLTCCGPSSRGGASFEESPDIAGQDGR